MLNIRHKLGSGRPYWYVTFFPSIVMFIGAIPLVLVYLRNMLSSTPPSTNYYPPAWVIWSLFTIIGYYLLARIFYKKPVVTVHRRKEERLWDRYGEQIVFMVIGAVLTIIGALIISYLTE